MLATYPEKFAGGAIIAGLPYACATSIPEAFERMRGQGLPQRRELHAAITAASPHAGPWPRLSVWHGDADSTVNPVNADAIVAQWSGVLGVAEEAETELIGRHRRQVWRDASGREVMESMTVSGMGHGTPLDPRCDGSAAGPFMLDVGISSTLRIARFWEIADEGLVESSQEDAAAPGMRGRRSRHLEAPSTVPKLRWPSSPADTSRPAKSGIAKTIEDALRAAGLMR